MSASVSWDEIKAASPNPAPDLPYVTAIWNYAEGMAAVRQRRPADAQRHYDALAKLAADPIMDDTDGLGPLPAGPCCASRRTYG